MNISHTVINHSVFMWLVPIPSPYTSHEHKRLNTLKLSYSQCGSNLLNPSLHLFDQIKKKRLLRNSSHSSSKATHLLPPNLSL